jgi:hypothetical protein
MIASAPAVVLGQTFFFPHLPGEGLSRVLRLMSALFRAIWPDRMPDRLLERQLDRMSE